MPRADAPRPAPLQIDRITRHDRSSVSQEGLGEILQERQIVGVLNLDDLVSLGELGRGNGGFVTKVRHIPTNQIWARKVIRIEVSQNEKNKIMKELEVLKDCNSPYIIGYFGACHRNGEINLLMEYMDGRSLDTISRRVKRISEDIIGKITISVIKGLTYLRDELNIMHRDIKPSNILVNSCGQIKICDFGVSGQLINSIAQSFVGTRQYMSPERLLGDPYTVLSDIWSLGLTLVELALGMYPIPQCDPMDMYEGRPAPDANIMSLFAFLQWIVDEPPPTIPGPPIFTSEFKEFVDRCLRKQPQERFDLRTIIQHAFITNSEAKEVDLALWVCQVCSGAVGTPAPTGPNQQSSP